MGDDRVTLSFDQSRDFIDCGAGRDTIAYVKRVDPKDVAVNCESRQPAVLSHSIALKTRRSPRLAAEHHPGISTSPFLDRASGCFPEWLASCLGVLRYLWPPAPP